MTKTSAGERILLSTKSPVHLVGIGGTGMRGLAMVLRQQGFSVSGSDRDALGEELTRQFLRAGVPVGQGHAEGNLPDDAGVLVVSAAIKPDNPEFQEAERRGLPIVKYAQALAEIASLRRTVAVAGSHGKTTTSSLVAWILKDAGLSESFLVGGEIAGLGTSGAWGTGTHFVLEACEYDRSFLNYDPAVAVVTNVDADHMDYYKTWEALAEAFAAFVSRVGPEGHLILSADDPRSAPLARAARGAVQTAGFSPRADWRLQDPALSTEGGAFRLTGPEGDWGRFQTRLYGRHNLANTAQAVAAAAACGVGADAARRAIASFRGVARRMERLGRVRGAPVLDDYGHHPVELAATFAAVRQAFPGLRLRAAFQPHQYARTEYLFDDFVRVLSRGPDDLLLAPVYGARHDGSAPKVDSATLAEAIRKAGGACRLLALEEIVEELGRSAAAGEVVLIIGAGDIGKVGHELVRRYGALEGT